MAAVRRIYVTPETWDTPAASRTEPDVELWCFSCRSQYAHDPIDEA